jgi:hypothetical protein
MVALLIKKERKMMIISFEGRIEKKKEEEIDKKCHDLHNLIYDLQGVCNRLDEIDVKDIPKTSRMEIARSITEIMRRLRKNRLKLF